jgi:hypothetical protein
LGLTIIIDVVKERVKGTNDPKHFPISLFSFTTSMKVKHAIILLAIGFCLDFFGSWMKIVHWATADSTLLAGSVLKITGTLLLLYKLLSNRKLRAWLNS